MDRKAKLNKATTVSIDARWEKETCNAGQSCLVGFPKSQLQNVDVIIAEEEGPALLQDQNSSILFQALSRKASNPSGPCANACRHEIMPTALACAHNMARSV
jgi:hypothetical protein